MKRNWQTMEFLREVYISSDCHYHFKVLLKGDGGRLLLEYSGGYWLYANRKNFSLFEAPKYVKAMIPAAFKQRFDAGEFTFYEYRKMGNDLVKDDDPSSLRYHDAELWGHVAQSMMNSGYAP